jgi:hypothetical protein
MDEQRRPPAAVGAARKLSLAPIDFVTVTLQIHSGTDQGSRRSLQPLSLARRLKLWNPSASHELVI